MRSSRLTRLQFSRSAMRAVGTGHRAGFAGDPGTTPGAQTRYWGDDALFSTPAAPVSTGPTVLFQAFADVNNGAVNVETDLNSVTIATNQMSANGQKLVAYWALWINPGASKTTKIRVYFGGINIYDSGALTLAAAPIGASGFWPVRLEFIRQTSTTARATVDMLTSGSTLDVYSEGVDDATLTGLNFAGTNILKLTGTSGGALGGANNITHKHSRIDWWPAA